MLLPRAAVAPAVQAAAIGRYRLPARGPIYKISYDNLTIILR